MREKEREHGIHIHFKKKYFRHSIISSNKHTHTQQPTAATSPLTAMAAVGLTTWRSRVRRCYRPWKRTKKLLKCCNFSNNKRENGWGRGKGRIEERSGGKEDEGGKCVYVFCIVLGHEVVLHECKCI
jgi:hypothetical protein